jgi:glycosyltransferase involved in cell wall biosynthesis
MESILRKKILFLTPWYPNKYDPMLGLFVKRHAELLSENYSVSVLYVYADNSVSKKYEIEMFSENEVFTVKIYYKKFSYNLPVIGNFIKFWRFYTAHYKGFREIKKNTGIPDLVHVNILTRVGLFALYLKYLAGIPYVITEHWSRYLPERNDYKGFFRKILTRIVVRNCAAISTVSVNLKKAMCNCGLYHPAFFLVNNTVNFELFKPFEVETKQNKKIFSNISCFENYSKNIFGIIRSVYELSKKRSDFLCIMVGDGIDRIKAEQLADKLAIKDTYIKFTGMLEGKALVEIYNLSSFTILFSNHENMPVVIPESFACGKPVLSTSVGGIKENINEKNGMLISRGDENEFVEKLNFMLDHCTDYDPVYIRKYAYDRFSKEAVKKQIMEMYSMAID